MSELEKFVTKEVNTDGDCEEIDTPAGADGVKAAIMKIGLFIAELANTTSKGRTRRTNTLNGLTRFLV